MKLRLWISTLVLLLTSTCALGAQYSGTLGKSAISFELANDSALYFYNHYRTPIDLSAGASSDKNTLIFIERNAKNKPIGEFHLQIKASKLDGYWLNVKTHAKLAVHLIQSADLRGVMQSASFKNRYIRVKCLNNGTRVTMIDKATDKTVQKLMVESSSCSLFTVSIGDYNFDGFADFSTAGESFAGPNTSRNYYIYQPQKHNFQFNEQLSSLVTLRFNQQSKIITSTNQCCAGSSISVDSYRWQKNVLKQIEGVCYKRNDNGDLVAKERKACY